MTRVAEFENTLNISKHKFTQLQEEMDGLKQSQSILDLCETVKGRMAEVLLSLNRAGNLKTKLDQFK